jgi:hypothetical protein
VVEVRAKRASQPSFDPTMTSPSSDVVQDLAPTGHLRASINLGNPVLAQGTPAEPSGVTVDIAREVAARRARLRRCRRLP